MPSRNTNIIWCRTYILYKTINYVLLGGVLPVLYILDIVKDQVPETWVSVVRNWFFRQVEQGFFPFFAKCLFSKLAKNEEKSCSTCLFKTHFSADSGYYPILHYYISWAKIQWAKNVKNSATIWKTKINVFWQKIFFLTPLV